MSIIKNEIIIFLLIVFMAFLSGCLKSRVRDSFEHANFKQKVKGVVILAIDPEDDHFSECIRGKLENKFVNILFIEGKLFRDKLYPWFEPLTVPKTTNDFSDILKNIYIKDRINSLNIDLLIYLEGKTLVRKDYASGGAAYGPPVIVGGSYHRTDISAQMWNLNDGDYLGELEVVFRGTAHYGLIGILPYYAPARTDSACCREIVDHISTWLKKFGSAGSN